MKNGTMVLESLSTDPTKCTFKRYRNADKGELWGSAVTIGKVRYEQGTDKEPKVYDTADTLRLTANGIEVRILPPQPKTEKVIPKGAWRDAKIAVEIRESSSKSKNGHTTEGAAPTQ